MKLVWGRGEIPCHDRCWTLDIDSDGYHRCFQFLILDLHKSEVGPTIFFFFFKNNFFIKK